MRLFANFALAICLAVSFIVPSLGHAHEAKRHDVRRHAELARRDPGEINLHKRFDGCRFTYYAVGLGACGGTNVPTDFVVALDAAQFYTGSYCYQTITITVGGKSTSAQIVDACPGCPPNGLDMSQGLFQFFADLSSGVLSGSWDFGSGSPAPSPSPSTPPPPAPTTSTPSTSWDSSTSPQLQTTTSAPLTTSSSSVSSIAHGSSNSSLVPTQTSSNPVAMTAGAVPGGAANTSVLLDVNLSIVYIGQLLGACSGLQ